DATTGWLTRYQTAGKQQLKAAIVPNFWRAMIDNDWGNRMNEWAGAWRTAGSGLTLLDFNVAADNDGSVKVSSIHKLPDVDGKSLGEVNAEYRVSGDGAVEVNVSLARNTDLAAPPRFGLTLELPGHLKQAQWFGRGPHENYQDRNYAAHVGLYQSTVEDLYVPYIRPQENGYRTDTRWLALQDAEGSGLRFEALGDHHFSFSALHNRQSDFETELLAEARGPGHKIRSVHTVDIKPRDLVVLNIDHSQMGVGGEDSWGARVLDHYTLREPNLSYRFRISPL
ncbi:MAG: beta-galactosidase small subunit, partial [Porticoccaceae bacterium]|nr:beta-galactosidase small subunit [Porticoccaceae bacterium]